MIKLKPNQIEVLRNASSDPRTHDEIAKSIGVVAQTVQRWRRKFPNGKGQPGVKGTRAKSSMDPTHKLLVKLVQIQLENNPEFLTKCMKLLDFHTIVQ